ncbi:Mobile element protein [Geitlerinema sp. FC II]|nr:Mobile element protein [Geitlerinema sp. FC II]
MSIEELEEVLGARCCILQEQMQEKIRNLTNYHWLNFA